MADIGGPVDTVGQVNGMPLVAALVLGPQGPSLLHGASPGMKLKILHMLAPLIESLRVDAAAERAAGAEESSIVRVGPRLS